MPPNYKSNPYGEFDFEVMFHEGDGSAAGQAVFADASGPEGPLIEYRNGTEDTRPRKIPGLKKFTNLTLKRGVVGDLQFWNWLLQGMSGNIQRHDGVIVLRDENRVEVMRWTFKRAWPTKWRGPGLTAKNDEIAIESLEIQHEGLAVTDTPPAEAEPAPDRDRERPGGSPRGRRERDK